MSDASLPMSDSESSMEVLTPPPPFDEGLDARPALERARGMPWMNLSALWNSLPEVSKHQDNDENVIRMGPVLAPAIQLRITPPSPRLVKAWAYHPCAPQPEIINHQRYHDLEGDLVVHSKDRVAFRVDKLELQYIALYIQANSDFFPSLPCGASLLSLPFSAACIAAFFDMTVGKGFNWKLTLDVSIELYDLCKYLQAHKLLPVVIDHILHLAEYTPLQVIMWALRNEDHALVLKASEWIGKGRMTKRMLERQLVLSGNVTAGFKRQLERAVEMGHRGTKRSAEGLEKEDTDGEEDWEEKVVKKVRFVD